MSIYFMASHGYIKVGLSTNPIIRSTQVTSYTKRPPEVPANSIPELLGWYPGDKRDELRAHAALDDHWVMGEWYVDCPEVRDRLYSHPEALIAADITAAALFATMRRIPLAEARAMYPMLAEVEAIA